LAILFHIKTMSKTVRDTFGLDADCMNEMERLIISRFDTIYSPAHALAFSTDPFYDTMRENLCEEFGEDFLTLGKGSRPSASSVKLH
jgi:hypothetical protein